MARVWIFQQARDVKAQGTSAPWFVGWYQGLSRRCKKVGSKTAARAYQARLESAANADEFTGTIKHTWQEVRRQFETELLATRRPSTRQQYALTFKQVEDLLAPKLVSDIDRAALLRFIGARTKAGCGKATINKDLRQLRAFLREAAKRKYIAHCPDIPFLKEPGKVPTYIEPEVFGRLYGACGAATQPADQGYTPEQWWQAYLIFLYLTGWRAMEPLSLTKEDIDWERQLVFLRAEHNKGDRDEVVPLHPLVLEHLAQVKSFGPHLLPWPLPRRKLWDIFHQIQDQAGVRKRDGAYFGFHDLRRGFATMNADRMSADALQAIMRHRDYGTTKRYINLARQLNPATRDIFVPQLPGKAGGA